jgi:DNA mismatch repair protein MutS
MAFKSILFSKQDSLQEKVFLKNEMPVFFTDLNLDQIIDAITSGKEEYNLKAFFYSPLYDEAEIIYRQEIMMEIQSTALLGYLQAFAWAMQSMRQRLPKKEDRYYQFEQERFYLEAVDIYCDAVILLLKNLSMLDLKSSGFIAFHKYLSAYAQSPVFTTVMNETKNLLNDLSSIRYSVITKELRVQVLNYKFETDYSEDVERTFEKFKREAVKDYLIKFPEMHQMNHVQEAILKGVSQIYPEIFKKLEEFPIRNINFGDQKIITFDREVQFYISYIEHISKISEKGLKFCYPKVSKNEKELCDYEMFDLALANILVKENIPLVCNDFFLTDKERIIIVTGPNQGGKTTFARSFGQLHYLAALGCPVPGREAKLFLFDNLFTHFEKEENLKNMRSKLEDDLFRIHEMIQHATTNSIIIMNEILSSTTLQDAILLSKKIMERISGLDALCVWVTFIEELLSFSDKTVSMVSMIVPENPAMRTFKVERKPANGLAYALSIAEKYRVTYDALQNRINV